MRHGGPPPRTFRPRRDRPRVRSHAHGYHDGRQPERAGDAPPISRDFTEFGHVQTVNPVVQLLNVKDRVGDPLLGTSTLRAQYQEPLQTGDTGGVRAAVPYVPQLGASQWRARFGIGIRFR